MRDEGLTCRENSFVEVSIKFHLSRAGWREGWAELGGGQSRWTEWKAERIENRRSGKGALTGWACLDLQA